jgi:hypothetical protein
MLGLGYALGELEEKILFEMIRDGWYVDMPKHQKIAFYNEWWSKRLN